MRLIDADELFKKISSLTIDTYNSLGQGYFAAISDVSYLIVNTPTVEPVKHGKWVVGKKCNHKPYRIKNPEKWVIYKCSICGYSNGNRQSNYCPKCGAKMEGE